MKKNKEAKCEERLQSDYRWPKPKRINIYIFENQLKMLQEIAQDKEVSKRHVFFEAIQTYIGTYLRNKEECEKRP
ncbi:MAG: hypothetical protein MUP52_11110 [Candidatus Aminicenantes bacterium]|nr:hypothetical protein [Candidatus Aminicenantes bacterium]